MEKTGAVAWAGGVMEKGLETAACHRSECRDARAGSAAPRRTRGLRVTGRRVLAVATGLTLCLTGCALPLPEKAEPASRYVLDLGFEPAGPGSATAASATSQPADATAPGASTQPGPVLLIAPTMAGPAFDGPRMLYVTRAYEVQAFARSEWADAPAKMLAPLLARALEGPDGFRTVQASTASLPALRLDTELLVLQQEFTQQPSRVRFALRAQLTDVGSRRLLATGEFEALEDAPSDDPYGGVVAANHAVARALGDLVQWARTAGR